MSGESVEPVSVHDCVRVYRCELLEYCVEVGDGSHGRIRKCDVDTILAWNPGIVSVELLEELVAWARFNFQDYLKEL